MEAQGKLADSIRVLKGDEDEPFGHVHLSFTPGSVCMRYLRFELLGLWSVVVCQFCSVVMPAFVHLPTSVLWMQYCPGNEWFSIMTIPWWPKSTISCPNVPWKPWSYSSSKDWLESVDCSEPCCCCMDIFFHFYFRTFYYNWIVFFPIFSSILMSEMNGIGEAF